MRELEDALRSSHRQLSTDTHPLLAEDLLRIKAPLERETPSDPASAGLNGLSKDESGPDIVDSFGSLSITDILPILGLVTYLYPPSSFISVY